MEGLKCNLILPFVIGFHAVFYASLNTRLESRSDCLTMSNVSMDDRHFNRISLEFFQLLILKININYLFLPFDERNVHLNFSFRLDARDWRRSESSTCEIRPGNKTPHRIFQFISRSHSSRHLPFAYKFPNTNHWCNLPGSFVLLQRHIQDYRDVSRGT